MGVVFGERVFLTAEQALDMLPDEDPIEVAENDPEERCTAIEYMDRQMLVAFINLPVARELAGPQAASMGYRLVLWRKDIPFFVKTKPLQ